MFHRWSVLTLVGDEPPTEFRIFKAGVNESQKGPILFDSQAANDVMVAYKEWGVDHIIDLNHEAYEADSRSRADASDARGHYKLELRDGELWAVGVKWTPDGERRLREKTQRYISPMFSLNPETGRVTKLLNCALVSMPATNEAQPLVAASS